MLRILAFRDVANLFRATRCGGAEICALCALISPWFIWVSYRGVSYYRDEMMSKPEDTIQKEGSLSLGLTRDQLPGILYRMCFFRNGDGLYFFQVRIVWGDHCKRLQNYPLVVSYSGKSPISKGNHALYMGQFHLYSDVK